MVVVAVVSVDEESVDMLVVVEVTFGEGEVVAGGVESVARTKLFCLLSLSKYIK